MTDEKQEVTAELEWCWREKGSDIAHGTYKSREEAIEEARSMSDSRVVLVGHCIYPDAAYCAEHVTDMQQLLEQMDEYAYANEYPFEDTVFDICCGAEKHKAAEAALKAALRAWADEFVDPPTAWHTSSDEEEVVIHPEADDE